MKPFQFVQPGSLNEAITQAGQRHAMYLAGGTTLLDLMKLNVLTPEQVVSIKPLLDKSIQEKDSELVLGAGCTMAQVANDALIAKHFPVVRQSLILAASPQIRNMATLGGNLMQRTRSPYFRHVDFPKEATRTDVTSNSDRADLSLMAVLGHSGRLLGTYPGDFGTALVALDGKLHVRSREGGRVTRAREFFLPPDKELTYRTVLGDGELIEAISIPITACNSHSMYFKVRERSSYAFALASAAIALELEGGTPNGKIVEARVGLGGIATIPWASREAEDTLRGKMATDEVFQQAADAALAAARPTRGLEYKVTLAKRVLVRALKTLRDSGVPSDQEIWKFQHGRES